MSKDILSQLIKISPLKDLDEFLQVSTNPVFNGRKGFNKARKHLQEQKGECIVIFHNWWTILRNGADWMKCLKLFNYMNDWKEVENEMDTKRN